MTHRIALAVGALVALIVLAIGIPTILLFRDAETSQLRLGMERDALVLADDLAALPTTQWSTLLGAYQAATGAREVAVDAQGRVVFDSDGGTAGTAFVRTEFTEALAGRTSTGVRISQTLGEELNYAAVPIRQGGQVIGALRVTMPQSTVDDRLRPLQWGLIALFVLVLVLAVLLSWAMASALARPLRRLADEAHEVGRTPGRAIGDIPGPPEVQSVADALSDTSTRLATAMARSRAVAEEASHHMRTPLAALRLRVEAMADLSDGDVHEEAEAALVEIDRLNRRIDQILAMARAQEDVARVVIELGAVVRARTLHWREARAGESPEVVWVPGSARGEVRVLPGSVDRTVDELVGNGLTYAHSRIEVAVGGSADTLWLTVTDDGPGIPADEREMVFDRFVRGSAATAGGSGLGLAMIREATHADGGHAHIVATATGTCVRVEWPRHQAADDAPEHLGSEVGDNLDFP